MEGGREGEVEQDWMREKGSNRNEMGTERKLLSSTLTVTLHSLPVRNASLEYGRYKRMEKRKGKGHQERRGKEGLQE